ncbi:hypothetical protein XA68_14842 [Ophiocordyceps unilateralis]|uniref:Uncharacterized protein n=1 Tax=Ophiocordyceps unilateralis TaxID=268505 RepID=A0A2A9PMP7_OPHUN|nr:hypothetical protein XA68_14842 [Ophiocordyceps unilateralis]
MRSIILAALSPAFVLLTAASPAEMSSAQVAAPDAGCYWSGTAPFCAGHCPSPYVECKQEKQNCWTGHKSRCCNPSSEC